MTDKQIEVQKIISAVIESMKNITDKTDYKSLVELSSKNLEKISWKIKINEPEKLLSTEDNSKIEADDEASNNIIAHTHHYGTNTSSKITKLDSNTPTYSNKPGERLDEWLFVLNQAFTVLDIRDGKQKLGLASTYVRGPVLQALIRYTKDDIHANWDGFTKILKDQYEPRNLDLKIRSQLRNLKQTDSFAKYLKRFQELSNQLPDATERELFLEFMDGLIDTYKHEVLIMGRIHLQKSQNWTQTHQLTAISPAKD